MKMEDLKLSPEVTRAVKELGFAEMTPIQEKCIPEIRQGKDVVGQSSTGSGKTFAFGLPILEKIEPGKGIQALILTPTRELCVQVTDAISTFGKYTHAKAVSVYGGAGIEPQIHALRRADIVVGTPGRIIDHIRRGTIRFGSVKILVLDEADKMFEMGFIEDVEFIIANVPKERQTMLFSATIPDEIHRLVDKHLKSPVIVKTQVRVAKNLLNQFYYDVNSYEKFSLLVHLLKKSPEGLAIVFCATRREVDVVARNLASQGLRAMAIHGGLSQNRRLDAIDALKNRSVNVLVATDVAARGLDIKNVSHIYNYDVPKTSDEYIHRIGRTARAGMEGDAVTLLAQRDHDNFRAILRDHTIEIQKMEKPELEMVKFDRPQRFSRESRYGGEDRRGYRGGGRFGTRRSSGSSRGRRR
ncbi:MAG: DEAD/DEAH box helicase [Candidatus Aenigmarchaeota archaeon]|nr:DEAD/DEAH box helicase [Candidatus Aenigmarchaeota archaeon]